MQKNLRNVILIALFVVMIITSIFFTTHPTHYKYCDLWIIGKHIDEVQERYGEFDFNANVWAGYHIYSDHYYYMRYDKDGIVFEVYDSVALGG